MVGAEPFLPDFFRGRVVLALAVDFLEWDLKQKIICHSLCKATLFKMLIRFLFWNTVGGMSSGTREHQMVLSISSSFLN